MIDFAICMGSSCFSRGNSRNLEVIQDELATRGHPADVQLVGHLCQGQCKQGPNLMINGQAYHEVDPVSVLGLLNQFVPRSKV